MLKVFLWITLMLFLHTSFASAAAGEINGVESLSVGTRDLLRKEMAEIQSGMLAIVPSYVAGKSGEIASIARQIKNSYILNQSLSAAQKLELTKHLPASFLQMDAKFHYYAGKLEDVALRNNQELIGFYFTKLLESCSTCHAQHAAQRFPDFVERKVENEHAH